MSRAARPTVAPLPPNTATVGTITMRVGGRYRLRNNAEVECRERRLCTGCQHYAFFVGPKGSGLTWNENGRYCAVDVESDFDVVAELESDGG